MARCTQTFTFGSPPPSEVELKCFVLSHLRNSDRRWESSTLASEFRVGETAVRADLALLGPEFLGVEIKSQRDSLTRLPRQISAYTRYFERVVLAVADCHLRQLDWNTLREVDVWKVSESGRVDVVSERSRLPANQCYSELLTVAERKRADPSASPDDFQAMFFDAFTRRYSPTSRAFWAKARSAEIDASDITSLSPFREQRDLMTTWVKGQQDDWSNWNASLAKLAGT